MDETSVVTGFLRNDGEVLLFRRSEAVGSYVGKWGAVAGHAEGDPDAAIREEISEETGLDPEADCTLVRRGEAFSVTDEALGTRWRVHPYLFDCRHREIEPNYETSEFEWAAPTAILRRDTVPKLWDSYDAVRPRAETVEGDSEHGSAYISIRALEVLRDESALLAEHPGRSDAASVAAVARDLLAARPSMVVVANRVHRVMDRADGEPEAVERATEEVLARALRADADAASALTSQLAGATVATLSRSGTVLRALTEQPPETVLVAESRPGREGVGVAEHLAGATDVVLTSDAGLAHQIAELGVDLLVVGADSITADGGVINKVGTRGAAAAARREGAAVIAVAATDKIRPSAETEEPEAVDLEPRPARELYDGEVGITVENPTFDVTPGALVDGVVTERGELDAAEINEVAGEHASRRCWL